MNWRAIRTIMLKDLRVVVQSRAVMIPLVMLPLILLVLLPGGLGIYMSTIDEDSVGLQDIRGDMQVFYDNMPAGIRAEVESLDNEIQRLLVLAYKYMFAPLYLILPLMVANVIAADSFVGEKERKTLEALIYSPTSDRELYLAKLLAPWAAAIAISTLGFILYALVVNVTAWPVMGRIFFPSLTWIILAVWVAPAAAGLGLGAMVLVSSRVSTFQEAYQVGGLVVLPVVLLLIGQFAGVVYISSALLIGLGFVLWAIDLAILWYGARGFQRGMLIARL